MSEQYLFFRKKRDFAPIEARILDSIKERGVFKGIPKLLEIIKKKTCLQLRKTPSGFFVLLNISGCDDGLMVELIFCKTNGWVGDKLDHHAIRLLSVEEKAKIVDSLELYRKFSSKGVCSYSLDEVLSKPMT